MLRTIYRRGEDSRGEPDNFDERKRQKQPNTFRRKLVPSRGTNSTKRVGTERARLIPHNNPGLISRRLFRLFLSFHKIDI